MSKKKNKSKQKKLQNTQVTNKSTEFISYFEFVQLVQYIEREEILPLFKDRIAKLKESGLYPKVIPEPSRGFIEEKYESKSNNGDMPSNLICTPIMREVLGKYTYSEKYNDLTKMTYLSDLKIHIYYGSILKEVINKNLTEIDEMVTIFHQTVYDTIRHEFVHWWNTGSSFDPSKHEDDNVFTEEYINYFKNSNFIIRFTLLPFLHLLKNVPFIIIKNAFIILLIIFQ